MRYSVWIGIVGCLLVLGCKQKNSDLELFKQSPIKVNLSADLIKGYEPLLVSFSAYLESNDEVIEKKISEVKWIIRGPQGFYREIIEETYNYQDEEENKENFFHLEYDFRHYGNYRVVLILNKGTYASPPARITVLENPEHKIKTF